MTTTSPVIWKPAFPPAQAWWRNSAKPCVAIVVKREIVSTQIANDLVNHMGITFVQRLKEVDRHRARQNVAGAYVIVRDIFHLPHWFRQIEALDHQVFGRTCNWS